MSGGDLALGCAAMLLGAFLGLFVGYGATGRRRTRRRASEGASELDVLRCAIAVSPYAIVVVDGLQDVVLHNARAEELGLMADPTTINGDLWERVREVFTTGEERHVELLAPTRRASGRPVESVGAHVLLLGDEKRQFVIAFGADVSEHVRMEAARRDFVANVSHELKTPVGAMALLAEALQETRDDPEQVDYFAGRVVSECRRLAAMVNELISLSRLQGAEKLPDPEVVSIDEVVDEAIHQTTTLAAQRSIALTTDGPSGLRVLGDRMLLTTAVKNLLTNAVNYSPEDTQVVVSRALKEGRVHVRVTDHGIGIPAEKQTRVFERFYRVDRARSRATGGTGLGLAIVKHVAKNHGGEITLWSQVGTGSTFTLVLPEHREGAEKGRGQ